LGGWKSISSHQGRKNYKVTYIQIEARETEASHGEKHAETPPRNKEGGKEVLIRKNGLNSRSCDRISRKQPSTQQVKKGEMRRIGPQGNAKREK